MDEEKEKSFILIEFDGINSVSIIEYKPENVTPLQLLALSEFLNFEGKAALSIQRSAQMQTQLQKQQKEQILVPKVRDVEL